MENWKISAEGIAAYLGENDYDIHIKDEVTSTNTVLKELAKQGSRQGYVLIANSQTAGKGRLGRKFYSPSQSGLYMSVLLRPDMQAQDALFITTSAAVAVSRAIKSCINVAVSPKIKWVNDIYIGDKKVCGILAESAIDFKTGKLDYAVLGIGVNISPPSGDFPDEIKDIAVSLLDKSTVDFRERLAAEILRELSMLPKSYTSDEILAEYRANSMLIGRQANAIFADQIKPCRVLDLDDRARLIVEFEDGTIEPISSGEVSVKCSPNG